MSHSNISIFIPHNGCPHKCSFCNQKNITGQSFQPDGEFVKATIEKALNDLGENSKNAEIAFFGGSFTAIDRKYMVSLLEAAKPYIDNFYGIRISTRPDYIDDEILSILKYYGVTSIELGAQSMCDDVLLKNNRGHKKEDVIISSEKIKRNGFELGLQMMTGLYGSSTDKDILTANEFVALNPKTVRIYPTITMKDTDLEFLYNKGIYKPYSKETTISLCAKLLHIFYSNNIDVIRMGLHYSDSLKENSVAGFYHPAFRELCENYIYYNSIMELLKNKNKGKYTILVASNSISKAIGQKRENIIKFKNNGYEINFLEDSSLKLFEAEVKK
ncbi:MAG: elongator complex protein 3 [Acutalibacteraceae bacterium]